MNDVSNYLAFAAGAFMGALIMGIWMGTIAHAQYEKYLAMKAHSFDQDQTIIDLENKAYPEQWVMVAEGGAEARVVRGRPDLDARREKRTSSLIAGVEEDLHGQEHEVAVPAYSIEDGTVMYKVGSDEDIPDVEPWT